MTVFDYKENQNSLELVKLLKASSVAYKKAKSKEFKIGYFLFFLAIAYPVCYLIFDNPELELYLFGASFFVTIITWALADYFRGNTEKGALLKEKFDTTLYNLPWKFTLEEPDEVEIISLEKEYKAKEIINWYPPNISVAIPHNNIIGICQHISSSWDIQLRSKYKKFLWIFLGVYWGTIFLFIVLKSIDGHKMFLIYFSTLAFYEHIIGLIRGNSNVIKRRKAIVAKLDSYINNRKILNETGLRDIQDDIYYTRQEQSKVPDFFCRKYNPKIQETLEEYVRKINNIYTV